jgi:hypothetical protein
LADRAVTYITGPCFGTVVRFVNCEVTATSTDGRRSTLEVDAPSLNYAAIEYNYRTVGN